TPQDAAELERTLAEMLASARAAWPDVELSDGEFLAHVARHVPVGPGMLPVLRGLHASDLYLACACALGRPPALPTFERRFLGRVPVYLAGRRHTPPFIEEVQQLLRTTVLVADGTRAPPIAGYAGRGPLGGWVRMGALRAALRVGAAHGIVEQTGEEG